MRRALSPNMYEATTTNLPALQKATSTTMWSSPVGVVGSVPTHPIRGYQAKGYA